MQVAATPCPVQAGAPSGPLAGWPALLVVTVQHCCLQLLSQLLKAYRPLVHTVPVLFLGTPEAWAAECMFAGVTEQVQEQVQEPREHEQRWTRDRGSCPSASARRPEPLIWAVPAGTAAARAL